MIKIVSKDKDKISFVTDMSETLANAIRRSVLEIPVLAIDELEIYKNDSALFDEILAQRMGLIPLIAEKGMTEANECSCKGKGCAKCTIQLKLKVTGPATVYSKDLKGKAEPVYEDIPIVILEKDQELELVATTKLGKGINHAKFSPGLMFYRNVANIHIDKNCDLEDCQACIKSCPQNVFKIEKGKLEVKDLYKCDLCEACVEECKKRGKDLIKVSLSEELIMFIESWGQIEARKIFEEAISSLENNLKELGKQVK